LRYLRATWEVHGEVRPELQVWKPFGKVLIRTGATLSQL